MTIGFHWPWMLVGLIALPALIGYYRWSLGRRRADAAGFSDVALVLAAMGPQPTWRRHLAPLLMLVVAASSLLALARPTITLDAASSRTSIILAIDISRSMCAVDVEPNRLTVAQDAAIAFIEEQSATTRIGIVAFAGFAELLVAPTNDTAVLVDAVGGLNTSFGTALGEATRRSIDAIAEVNPDVEAVDATVDPGHETAPTAPTEPVPDVVVLLTDGASTQGLDPIVAADAAARRGVRLYTIGFGTTEPTTMVCNIDQAGADFIADPFGDQMVGDVGPAGDFGQIGGFGGRSQLLTIDEPTLQTVAETTGGDYYRARDAAQLNEVFGSLPTQPVTEPRPHELTVGLLALSAVCSWGVLGRSARSFPA